MKSRAFSLLEMMVGLAITSLILGLGLLQLRGARDSSSPRALAMVLAEELRRARETAIASQAPVAVCLPSNSLATPLAQKLYVASGLSMARVTRVLDLSGDFPQALLFQGTWPASSAFSSYPRLNAQRHSAFDASRWLRNPNFPGYDMSKDFALVFTPEGGVVSNGLPYSQGAYHWVAASGAAVNPTASPGSATPGRNPLACWSLTTVGNPYTVSVASNGEISVQAGLPGLVQGGVNVIKGNLPISRPSLGTAPTVPLHPASLTSTSLTLSNPPADLPAPSTGKNGLFLSPEGATPPPPFQLTLVPGQRMSVALNVTDTSGADVYVQWHCDCLRGNCGPGVFSKPPRPERMHWDEANQCWSASWDWECPRDSRPNDQFHFYCDFSDAYGTVVPRPNLVRVKTQSQTKFFAFYDNPQFQHQLVCCNADGSGPSFVTAPYGNQKSSGDGLLSVSASLPPKNSFQVYSTQSGQLLRNATVPVPPGGCVVGATLSWNGDKVGYLVWTGAWHEYWICNTDGSGARRLLSDSGPGSFNTPQSDDWNDALYQNRDHVNSDPNTHLNGTMMSFTPDGSQIAFSAYGNHVNTNPHLCVANTTGTVGTTAVFDSGQPCRFNCWSQDGQTVYFTDGGGLGGEVFSLRIHPLAASPVQLTSTGGKAVRQQVALDPLDPARLYLWKSGNMRSFAIPTAPATVPTADIQMDCDLAAGGLPLPPGARVDDFGLPTNASVWMVGVSKRTRVLP
ncbi:prepilin-type N-terminal cleavage/methylation domain-containing protein [bacterium]|nr:prepilin-type N-terminal cleavage/methylation domain-containing protein [bacterium]